VIDFLLIKIIFSYDKLRLYKVRQGRRQNIDNPCAASVKELQRTGKNVYVISATNSSRNTAIIFFKSDASTQSSGFSISFKLGK